MSLPTQINIFSRTIPLRYDGLKAFIYTTDFGATNQMQLFTDADNMRAVNFTGMPAVNEMAAAWLGDRLILAQGGAGGVKVCIYQVTDDPVWNPVETFTFGTSTSEFAQILILQNGAVVVASYQHYEGYIVDLAYRYPDVPTKIAKDNPAAVLPTQWFTKNIVLEPPGGGLAPLCLALAEAPFFPTGQNILLFATRDASHCVKLAQFDYSLNLLGYLPAFLSDATNPFTGKLADGPMAPDGEFPQVCAATDWVNKEVLITYQQSRWIYSINTCETIQTRPVLVALDGVSVQGISKRLVSTIPDPVNRSINQNPILLTPGAVFVVYNYITTDCNAYEWRLAQGSSGDPGKFLFTIDRSDFSAMCALSQDGWIAFRDPVDFMVNLGQLPFIKTQKMENLLKLTWPGAGTLQESSDLTTWADSKEQNGVPFEMIDGRIFRVKY